MDYKLCTACAAARDVLLSQRFAGSAAQWRKSHLCCSRARTVTFLGFGLETVPSLSRLCRHPYTLSQNRLNEARIKMLNPNSKKQGSGRGSLDLERFICET